MLTIRFLSTFSTTLRNKILNNSYFLIHTTILMFALKSKGKRWTLWPRSFLKTEIFILWLIISFFNVFIRIIDKFIVRLDLLDWLLSSYSIPILLNRGIITLRRFMYFRFTYNHNFMSIIASPYTWRANNCLIKLLILYILIFYDFLLLLLFFGFSVTYSLQEI